MTESDPLVSVVIPAYNRGHLLERALRSVLNQTVPAAEVIVVDDGSRDGSFELVSRQYPQVKCIRQNNSGVSAARNRGILESRGDWLALLDSDDEWRPDKLEKQSARIRKVPDCVVCHSDEIWIRNGRRVNPMEKHRKRGGDIYLNCLSLCAMSPSTVLINRRVFQTVGLFDPDLPACEDYDLWLRICARFPVELVAEPLVTRYGGHQDQLSRKYWGMDRFRIRALQKMLDSAVLDDAQRLATLETLREKAGIVASGARRRGNLDLAERYRQMVRQWC